MTWTRLSVAVLTVLLIVQSVWASPSRASPVVSVAAQVGTPILCPGAHYVTFPATPPQIEASTLLHVPWQTRVTIPLRVVLEWQTHGIDDFKWWLWAMLDAGRFLAYATNGQATIGRVELFDNACQWASADVQVYAHNTGIPDATIGGIAARTVTTLLRGRASAPKLAVSLPSISAGGAFPSTTGGPLASGSIRLGRSWSEAGPLQGRWTDAAGFRTIVHELGHYAFYLYDEYYGYADGNPSNPRPVASCFGPGHGAIAPQNSSLMYWEYSRDTFWYWKPGMPLDGCDQTRQWQVYKQSDWAVITAHYPSLVHVTPSTSFPALPPCPGCDDPMIDRWHLWFEDPPLSTADGYLVKWAGARVLHQGVPCPNQPPKQPCLPGQSPGQLEVVGGDAGDVVRVTGTDTAGDTRQASRVLTGPRGDTPLLEHRSYWYSNVASIPTVDAVPVLSHYPGVGYVLTGLKITATDPSGAHPVVPEKQISATLYEAGLGPENLPRHPTTVLAGAGTTHTGSLSLVSGCTRPYLIQHQFRCPPILDGSLYLTPLVSGRPQQLPDRPDGQRAIWELASLSLNCNSPTDFLVGHAPSDEGGLDSADGVVSVHLTSSDPRLQDFCLAITSEPPGASAGSSPFTRPYTIRGTLPGFPTLPGSMHGPNGSQSVYAVVTFHYDTSLLRGARPVVVRSTRTGVSKKPPALTFFRLQCDDTGSGTVSIRVPLSALNGQGQYQVISSSGLRLPFKARTCGSTGNRKG